MRLKTSNTKVFKPLWLVLGLGLTISTPHAANFYTIIGPDGHPMIVQKPPGSEKKLKEKQKKSEDVEQIEQPRIERTTQEKTSNLEKTTNKVPTTNKVQTQVEKSSQQTHTIPSSTESQVEVPSTHSVKAPKVQISSEQNNPANSKTGLESKKIEQNNVKAVHAKTTDIEKQALAQPVLTQPNSGVTLPTASEVKSSTSKPLKSNSSESKVTNTNVSDAQEKVQDNKNFTVIEGEKYVNNEFLEDSEFNLEGKKRFYMTPEVGSGHSRFETIERKKGLSLSFMERALNREPTTRKPIALSSTYYRLPKEEVVKNLEQSCFSGKKLKKAKDLSIKNQELGVWPTAPIKEGFAYEVVKLDGQINNVLLTSYASSTKVPTYYWPLVVFLDQQGCVIEGVSGFKNEDINANDLQYASMEGILRKPSNATYMFLTPLSSAVDVENRQLTNHGQIKLSVIQ